jgi:hypothetical protein
MTEKNEQKGMHRRRIMLADGRYMIFYTFDERLISELEVEGAGAARAREPHPESQAEEEERSV